MYRPSKTFLTVLHYLYLFLTILSDCAFYVVLCYLNNTQPQNILKEIKRKKIYPGINILLLNELTH